MMRSPLPNVLVPALLCAALCPGRAHGYAEEIHVFIAQAALRPSGLDAKAAPIPATAAAGVRAALDSFARSGGDTGLQKEWVRRYPTPAAFDAWAEKELLLLSPRAEVFGIDKQEPPAATLLELVVRGSREPDDDWRNRERLAFDASRQPLKDRAGGPVPADPAILNMGKLGFLSSQAHAHYGLAQVEFTDDPDVLKSDPRRFAVPAGYKKGPILTLAAEMAQEHLDLALLAALLPEGASQELAWLHTGQAFHYLEDVGNQIHTVQVGLHAFFVDAFLARIKMGLMSGGGYVGKMRSLASIGIDILTNHHVLSEMYTQKRVREALAGKTTPESARLVAAPAEEDPEFSARLDEALKAAGDHPERGEFGLIITRTLIEASSREGADVYSATRAVADPRLRKEGVLFDEHKDDPDAAVIPKSAETEARFREFFALQEKAFRRCGTAMRRWVALEKKALEGAGTDAARAELRQLVSARLLKRQLRMLGEAEARRADYLADPPVEVSAPERMPLLLGIDLVVIGLLALIVRALLRRGRARR